MIAAESLKVRETDDLTWLRLAFQAIILTPAAR